MATSATQSIEELDAELARLLLDDDDDGGGDGGGDHTLSPPPPPPNQDLQLEQRVAVLERVLADRLDAFQELAELRIERAAMDAAMAVRRALVEPPPTQTGDAISVITQDI